jgi:hypothetical protein
MDEIIKPSQDHWEVVDAYRDIISNTEEELWDNALSYFRWIKDNPIQVYRTAMTGKDTGKRFLVEMPRMMTIKGLCLHCNVLEEYLRDIRNSADKTSLYYIVVSKILYIIHTQNMEYAALDIFNTTLVSRALNMEKDDTPTGKIIVEHVHGLPALASSENEVLEKLEQENQLFQKGEI